MKEEIEIREITFDEINDFVEIIRSSLKDIYLIPSIYRSNNINKFILNEMTNKLSPYKYFGVFVSNILITSAEFKFSSFKTVFLNMIATKPGFQNQGLGKKLFNYAIDYFIKNNIENIELDVYGDNINALNWYEKIGFNEKSTSLFYEVVKNMNVDKKMNIFINNFPQYEIMKNEYDFGYIDVTFNSGRVSFGFIKNDLILRNESFDLHDSELINLYNNLNFENIYFITGIEDKSIKMDFINKIHRLRLKING